MISLPRLRLLVTGYAAVYLLIRAPHLWDVAVLAEVDPRRWAPVGPLGWWNNPWSPGVVRGWVVGSIVAAALAATGWRWRLTGPLAGIGTLVVLSYRSSWGQIFHTENLLVLHLLILGMVALIDGDRPGRRTGSLGPQAMVVVLVVAYVLAGWAKLRTSGIAWVAGDALRNHVAHDNLRKALVGDWYSPLGGWAVAHGWVFPPMAVLSLLVELLAPIVFFGGRLRTVWVIAAWAFHVGVLGLMAILFPYQLTGVAFACCWAVSLRDSSRSS